jgi:butyrate kinase
MKMVKRQGGQMAHLGTTDRREVEKRIADADGHARLIYDAMALNVAENIAKCAPFVKGKVDAILLTGGTAYSKYFTEYIRERVEFIAPVIVYAGEDEMLSLALGGLRVLRGEEKAATFVKNENPGY